MPIWLLTPSGFCSVVQKSGDSWLTVRARVAADLDSQRERDLAVLEAALKLLGSR